MHVQLLVPALFDPDFSAAAPASGDTPALDMLLARGRRTPNRYPGTEAWLLNRFGVAVMPLPDSTARGPAAPAIAKDPRSNLPVAPYALLGEYSAAGLSDRQVVHPGDAPWICADPVHLRVDRDRLVLADASVLDLRRDEADALCDSLNRHFSDVMTLLPVQPDRWYARLNAMPDMATTPLLPAVGGVLDSCMPEGRDGGRWRAVINEAQMLIFEHPVNLAREAAGKPVANGVWFWGAGSLRPDSTEASGGQACVPAPLAWLAADMPLARGLAQSAGIATHTLPLAADRWQAAGNGIALIVADALRRPAAQGDAEGWHAALASLERDWFAPLLNALRRGRIGMVTLFLGGHASLLQVETARADLRYFWRRPKPLAAYQAGSLPGRPETHPAIAPS